MAKLTWLALCALAALSALGSSSRGADAARILVVMPMPARSHLIVFTALTRALAERGHHITLVAPLKAGDSIVPDRNHELVSVWSEKQLEDKREAMAQMMSGEKPSVLTFIRGFMEKGPALVRAALDHPNFKAMAAKPGQRFDLVIVEAFFLQESLVALGHQFDAPVVALNPFGTSPMIDEIMGNPTNPAWVPNPFLGFSDRMSFSERVVSTLARTGTQLLYWWYALPMQQALVSEYFPSAPPLSELLLSRLAVTLVNNHHSLGYPVPMAPGVVEVGGMHIRDQPKPLPQDLKKIMDGAKEGVVYFSMGSNLMMDFLPEAKMYAIFNSLGALKERVLLKWDGPVPKEGVPKNIRIIEWAPQADILAHPNLRLFVTHGGLLSTQESVYNGVPLVGIPVFGDQDFNMKLASKKGFCEMVSFEELSEEKLTAAMKKVLGNPSYRESAGRLSRLFRAQPSRPAEQAVFWVEHAMQHGGAHLRPASVRLPLHQLLLLDVLAVLLLPVLLLVLLLRAMCRCCCGGGGGKRPTASDRKKRD